MAIDGGFTARWRIRRLTRASRAGTYARERARAMHHGVLRRDWPVLFGVVLALPLVALLPALFIASPFGRGVIIGASASVGVAVACFLVRDLASAAPRAAGGRAESWTAAELRPPRRGDVRILHHVQLGCGDLDHVAVGPWGMVLLETKWSSWPWRLDGTDERLDDMVAALNRRARQLRLWAPVKRHNVSVVPVLVLWGAVETFEESSVLMDGVTVIPGVALAQRWRVFLERTSTRPSTLPPSVIDEVVGSLAEQTVVRGKADRERNPGPPSWGRLAGRGLLGSLALLGPPLFLSRVLADTSIGWALGAAVASCVPFVVLLHQRVARYLAYPWLLSVGLCLLALAALVWSWA